MNELIDNTVIESDNNTDTNLLKDNKANIVNNKLDNPRYAGLRPAKPGEVRNPTGRPKLPEELVNLCKDQALAKLKDMFSEKVWARLREQTRVELIKIALDRAYGKALQLSDTDIKQSNTIAIIEINRNDKQEDSIKTIEAQVEDSKHNDT